MIYQEGILFRPLQLPPAMVGANQSRTADTRRVSGRVLDAIAEAEGTDPIEFNRPLYDVIDPDALDGLVQSAETSVYVEFSYLGYEVTVCPDGDINLGPPDE